MAQIFTSKETLDNLPERDPLDHYPTPIELCRAMVSLAVDRPAPVVLDPGAGTGVFGQAARERWPDAHIIGVEIDERHEWPASVYDEWFTQDYLTVPIDRPPTLIVGNPPYGGRAGARLAEAFIRRSLNLLWKDGELIFLLRTEFQNSLRGAAGGLFSVYPPYQVYPLVQRPSFDGTGRTQAQDYTVIHWTGGYHGQTWWRPLSWR